METIAVSLLFNAKICDGSFSVSLIAICSSFHQSLLFLSAHGPDHARWLQMVQGDDDSPPRSALRLLSAFVHQQPSKLL